MEVEWKYLFQHAKMSYLNASNFPTLVLNSTDFWVVGFMDGLECSSCKTAVTNMLRLGAALQGIAKVGIVDCSIPRQHSFCYQIQNIPTPPHAAIVKAWRKGPKYDLSPSNRGEMLYNANELEPHLALQITERAIRLALSHDMLGDNAVSANGEAAFDKHKDEPKRESRKPMWNGPTRKAPLPWDGSGGKGRNRQRLSSRV